jgi:hypothetical protein
MSHTSRLERGLVATLLSGALLLGGLPVLHCRPAAITLAGSLAAIRLLL